MHIIGMINNLCHMIDMYRGVATLNKLINIDGDAEEVCNFAHIETIYIRLHEKKFKQCVFVHITIPPPEKGKL